jgi:hypothetical protein
VERRPLIFPLGSRFFGLTPQYRVSLFTQIHEIVFHGNGGYDYYTIYNMPIWLRNFTFNKMREHYDKEAAEMKKAQGKSGGGTTVVNSEGKIEAPEHFQNAKPSPTYITKASKK